MFEKRKQGTSPRCLICIPNIPATCRVSNVVYTHFYTRKVSTKARLSENLKNHRAQVPKVNLISKIELFEHSFDRDMTIPALIYGRKSLNLNLPPKHF